VFKVKDTKNFKGATEVQKYSRYEKILGNSWEEWAARWWNWVIELEKRDKSPCIDPIGSICENNQFFSEIWFLAGTHGGKAFRNCTVPINKSLFFPIINDLISFAEYDSLKSESDLIEYAKADLDTTTVVMANLDNYELQDLDLYRVRTNLFDIDYPLNELDPTNGLRLTKRTKAISDGYWVCLKPLSPGKHLISFKGEKLAFDELYNNKNLVDQPKFSLEVEYDITVKV
jgi:hypothetical protein